MQGIASPTDSDVGVADTPVRGLPSAPPHIAIRTNYRHHGDRSGYKQLLRYTRPVKTFGVVESATDSLKPWNPIRRYKWLAEIPAAWYARRRHVRLIHILYGEEYFRFSTYLPSSARIVVTFHQPPDLLLDEMWTGSRQGRLYGLSHRLTRGRLQAVDKVIATTEQQKEVLAQFIPSDRIVCIPLGCYSIEKTQQIQQEPPAADRKQILTVGNWRRDWDLYHRFLQFCSIHHTDWQFVLVNRAICGELLPKLQKLPNFRYEANVDDARLMELHLKSRVQFLPLLSAAGSNAVNDSLAFGLPVLTNTHLDPVAYGRSAAIQTHTTGDVPAMAERCGTIINLPSGEFAHLRREAMKVAESFDWSVVAAKTIQLYWSLL